MDTVGVRELKTHLSRHLKRVRSGARLLVTERGIEIATISPVDAPNSADWAHAFVAEGGATWTGAKPGRAGAPVRLVGEREAAVIVIEDRRGPREYQRWCGRPASCPHREWRTRNHGRRLLGCGVRARWRTRPSRPSKVTSTRCSRALMIA